MTNNTNITTCCDGVNSFLFVRFGIIRVIRILIIRAIRVTIIRVIRIIIIRAIRVTIIRGIRYHSNDSCKGVCK
jgi:hypothetical protein